MQIEKKFILPRDYSVIQSSDILNHSQKFPFPNYPQTQILQSCKFAFSILFNHFYQLGA